MCYWGVTGDETANRQTERQTGRETDTQKDRRPERQTDAAKQPATLHSFPPQEMEVIRDPRRKNSHLRLIGRCVFVWPGNKTLENTPGALNTPRNKRKQIRRNSDKGTTQARRCLPLSFNQSQLRHTKTRKEKKKAYTNVKKRKIMKKIHDK